MDVLRRLLPVGSAGIIEEVLQLSVPPLAQPVDEVARAIPHGRATRLEARLPRNRRATDAPRSDHP